MTRSRRRWNVQKVDVLFVVGVGLIIYGAVIRDVSIIVAGAGITGIPITQRQQGGEP